MSLLMALKPNHALQVRDRVRIQRGSEIRWVDPKEYRNHTIQDLLVNEFAGINLANATVTVDGQPIADVQMPIGKAQTVEVSKPLGRKG